MRFLERPHRVVSPELPVPDEFLPLSLDPPLQVVKQQGSEIAQVCGDLVREVAQVAPCGVVEVSSNLVNSHIAVQSTWRVLDGTVLHPDEETSFIEDLFLFRVQSFDE